MTTTLNSKSIANAIDAFAFAIKPSFESQQEADEYQPQFDVELEGDTYIVSSLTNESDEMILSLPQFEEIDINCRDNTNEIGSAIVRLRSRVQFNGDVKLYRAGKDLHGRETVAIWSETV
ncbi:MAG: hypothetical protein ACRC5M_04810 [Anaeroplasmataceae bacterium]